MSDLLWVRVVMDDDGEHYETSPDGVEWTPLKTFLDVAFPASTTIRFWSDADDRT